MFALIGSDGVRRVNAAAVFLNVFLFTGNSPFPISQDCMTIPSNPAVCDH